MNTDKNEIEVKYYLGDNVSELRHIVAQRWQRIGVQEQSDTYYTSKYKDFIATEECLRIRCTDAYEELTWKPPSSVAMKKEGQYWKEELNVKITGQSATIRKMLEKLDFIEYVTVLKRREIFKIDSDSIVALDHIEGLGWFVEIETLFHSDRDEEGVNRNYKIAEDLGIRQCPQIDEPYRDLVKRGSVR